MKSLFHRVGFALVLLLSTVRVDAAHPVAATYQFPGAQVVFLASPCQDAAVLKNITAYHNNTDGFYAAIITFTNEQPVVACYQTGGEGDAAFDIHWGNQDYEVLDFSAGTKD